MASSRRIFPRSLAILEHGFIIHDVSSVSRQCFSTLVPRSSCLRVQKQQQSPPAPYPAQDRRRLHWWNKGKTRTGASLSSSSSSSRSSMEDSSSPSFKVARVSYQGDLRTVNLRTSELLRSASIYARDLFTLNLTSRQERRRKGPVRRTMSAIMPRTDVIVLSFGNVRAVAGLDHVFLFDAHNPLVQDFSRGLAQAFTKNSTLLVKEPNELIFLEEVLRDSMDAYNRRLRLFEPIVDSFLDRVANEVYSDTGVHQLVPLKDSLQSFEIQVKQALDCLTELLNNDQDMLDLLLTEQADAARTGKPVDFLRHEHVELLLGVYARQLSNTVMEISYLLQRLQSKQEFVALALSGYRNRMIRMNVHIGIAGLSLGLGTTVAGLFGMNLVSGLEMAPNAFLTVVLGSGLAASAMAAGSLNYLSGHKMQMRAAQRMDEIETLAGALSDMCALDYTVKTTIEQGKSVDKESFRKILKKARQSKRASQKEVDLLFDILDRVKDGELSPEDMKEYDDRFPSGLPRGKL